MHARTYMTPISRFVSPDPRSSFSLFVPQDANRYTYGLNSPTTFTDPTGADEVGTHLVPGTGKMGAETGATGTDPDAEDRERELQIRLWMLQLENFWNSTRFYTSMPEKIRGVADASWMDSFARHILYSAADLLPENFLSIEGALWVATSLPSGGEGNAVVMEAERLYPKLAGLLHRHHKVPMYLGGAANGERVEINAAYHQLITNMFRDLWKYGQGAPPPEVLEDILLKVYTKYPLP